MGRIPTESGAIHEMPTVMISRWVAAIALTTALASSVVGCGPGDVVQSPASAATTTVAPNGDLRGRSDDELKALMPPEKDFPFPVQADYGPMTSRPEPKPPIRCDQGPLAHLGPNLDTVTSLSGSNTDSRGVMRQDLIGLGLYRIKNGNNVLSSVRDFVTACPEFAFKSDFGEDKKITYRAESVPTVAAEQTYGYSYSHNTIFLAESRGLVVKLIFMPDSDRAVAERLFRTVLDNISKA